MGGRDQLRSRHKAGDWIRADRRVREDLRGDVIGIVLLQILQELRRFRRGYRGGSSGRTQPVVGPEQESAVLHYGTAQRQTILIASKDRTNGLEDRSRRESTIGMKLRNRAM